MSVIGDGIDLLKLVDKGHNADLYKQLGVWIDKVQSLMKDNQGLSEKVASLEQQLRFKGKVERIGGHTFVEGDDEEVCSRCAEVDHRPVHHLDISVDGKDRKATCPQCKMGNGTMGPPISRKKAEEEALRLAAR